MTTTHDSPIPGWRRVTDGSTVRLYRDDDDASVTVSAEGDHTTIVLRRGDDGAPGALLALLVYVLYEVTP